ncbi:MAG TPA: decaprenyl-phosphate phosphoribosyltransferase [Candidatus Binatia bacterium]|nr:decaprenyl-phosphate phosphoribosyltransferase [Candidatus Binatia bacterium]
MRGGAVGAYLRLLRPHHWTKNFACLAGVLFSGKIGHPDAVADALATFLVFCAASSAVYALNDVLDRARDREHPRKRSRPVASGAIAVPAALAVATVLGVAAFAGAARLGAGATVCLAAYVVNNVAYSMMFKHVALFDVLSIALGFVFRLLAGVYVVNELPTTWITLCAFFLALFVGFGKRRAELAGLGAHDNARRPVLARYTLSYLDSLLNSSAVMTVMCYALFTTSSGKNPSLVVGVPIVFYAIMHYKRLVMLLDASEEPERVLLRDLPIQVSIALWLATYVLIEHGGVHFFR